MHSWSVQLQQHPAQPNACTSALGCEAQTDRNCLELFRKHREEEL